MYSFNYYLDKVLEPLNNAARGIDNSIRALVVPFVPSFAPYVSAAIVSLLLAIIPGVSITLLLLFAKWIFETVVTKRGDFISPVKDVRGEMTKLRKIVSWLQFWRSTKVASDHSDDWKEKCQSLNEWNYNDMQSVIIKWAGYDPIVVVRGDLLRKNCAIFQFRLMEYWQRTCGTCPKPSDISVAFDASACMYMPDVVDLVADFNNLSRVCCTQLESVVELAGKCSHSSLMYLVRNPHWIVDELELLWGLVQGFSIVTDVHGQYRTNVHEKSKPVNICISVATIRDLQFVGFYWKRWMEEEEETCLEDQCDCKNREYHPLSICIALDLSCGDGSGMISSIVELSQFMMAATKYSKHLTLKGWSVHTKSCEDTAPFLRKRNDIQTRMETFYNWLEGIDNELFQLQFIQFVDCLPIIGHERYHSILETVIGDEIFDSHCLPALDWHSSVYKLNCPTWCIGFPLVRGNSNLMLKTDDIDSSKSPCCVSASLESPKIFDAKRGTGKSIVGWLSMPSKTMSQGLDQLSKVRWSISSVTSGSKEPISHRFAWLHYVWQFPSLLFRILVYFPLWSRVNGYSMTSFLPKGLKISTIRRISLPNIVAVEVPRSISDELNGMYPVFFTGLSLKGTVEAFGVRHLTLHESKIEEEKPQLVKEAIKETEKAS